LSDLFILLSLFLVAFAGMFFAMEEFARGILLCCLATILLLIGVEKSNKEYYKTKMIKVEIAEYYLDKDYNKKWRIKPEFQERFKKLEEKTNNTNSATSNDGAERVHRDSNSDLRNCEKEEGSSSTSTD